jgi:sugar O-acyltransferase (sialic acid O-acetyltransferase NeuD family)
MSKTKKLLIYGTGTLGEIAAFYFIKDSQYDVLGFTDADEYSRDVESIMELPVIKWSDVRRGFPPGSIDIFVAIGYRQTNSVRQMRYERVKSEGYSLASYISSKASIFTEKIGENCFVLENNVLQPFVEVGNNVTLWSGNHIGHHSVIEDHVFIASHVVISGKCRIGANSFIGVNSCLHDNVTIGQKSVLGAGAIVAKTCGPRSLFVPIRTEPKTVDKDLL